MKATNSGRLNVIDQCEIVVPHASGVSIPNYPPILEDTGGKCTIRMQSLPDINDSKSAVYNNEPIIGRSAPLYTYSHSADRTIGFQIHLYVVEPGDAERNLQILRIIQSAVYPRDDPTYPYLPPPICQIKCGGLLTTGESLCVVLQSYNVKFATEVVWYGSLYCPARIDIDTTWLVVYDTTDLPWQNNIIKSGR